MAARPVQTLPDLTAAELDFVRATTVDWRIVELLTDMTGRRDLARSFSGSGQASVCWEYDPTGVWRTHSRHEMRVSWDAVIRHGDRIPASIRGRLIAAQAAWNRYTSVQEAMSLRPAIEAAVAEAMTPLDPEPEYLDLLELLAVMA